MLFDLQRLGKAPGAQMLLEPAEKAANLVPLRRGGFRFFLLLLLLLLRCRRGRRRDLVQLLARAFERRGERDGRRMSGKPLRARAGKGGEPLAERGDVRMRAGALELRAQRLGQRGRGAELAQRLHLGLHQLVRACGEIGQFLGHIAIDAQLVERLLQLAQASRGKRARRGRQIDQAAEPRGELRCLHGARGVAPAHAQQVVAVPVDAVVAVLGRFRDALEERRVGDALHGGEAHLPQLRVACDIGERFLFFERLQQREPFPRVCRRADLLGPACHQNPPTTLFASLIAPLAAQAALGANIVDHDCPYEPHPAKGRGEK